jgi:ABC-type cobalt transport system substrate-binding protein
MRKLRRNLGIGLLILVAVFLISIVTLPFNAAAAKESKESKWPGVDEAVIEKIAKEHGREAKEPLIGDDQGDIMLFLFLTAGTVGGFVAGYYWRALVSEKGRKEELGESFAGSPGGHSPAERRE